jgi:DNA-binding GntR family transcriptional regulator
MAQRAPKGPLALAPVTRVDTLGDQAYAQLREAIASGAMLPGQRLSVRGLVDALGIGFTPAREALNRLAAEGALQPGPNRTLAVPALTLRKYQEVVAIRSELEPLAAVASLPRLTDPDIDALAAIQRRLLDAMARRDYVAVLACNREFHFTLYRRADMPTLLGILEGLWLQTGPTLRHLYPGYALDWKGGINHDAILAALRDRDARRVGEAIRRDLDDGRQRVVSELARLEAERGDARVPDSAESLLKVAGSG